MAITIIEEWRPVPIDGFAEFYEVSSTGRVRSLRKAVDLTLRVGNRGYVTAWLQVGKMIRNATVHRLVAGAFIPNPDGLPEVNHKDFIRTNNSVGNLEWVSRLGNFLHADAAGRAKFSRKLTDHDVAEIRRLGDSLSQVEIADRFALNSSTVSRILRGLLRRR